MDDHFAAFSFVDRIVELTPAVRARGRFAVPAGIAEFPSCLSAEAVGQLAAWVAMAHIDYRGRPVAALAQDTRFHRSVRPGDTLELAVEIEHCDDEAVAYHGSASMNGVPAIELNDCLGPMLPVAEFDSPRELSARFELLCGAGAPPGRFRGIEPSFVEAVHIDGNKATALLHVPQRAPFFNDHFPRRPVFPATLLLNEQIALALRLARASPRWSAGTSLAPLRMTNVKVRAFTPPGQVLEIGAELGAPNGAAAAVVTLTARAEGRMVATSRVEIGPHER